MIKEKIEDLCNDLHHIKYQICNYIRGLRRWFSYYKVLTSIYDFDYDSILAVERVQLTRVRNNLVRFHHHVDWQDDVKHIDLALRILDIIEEDGCVERIGEPFSFIPFEMGRYQMESDPNEYWHIPVYVNTRNSKRFWKDFNPEHYDNPKSGDLWRDHLRVEKAWHLYHKIRTMYMRSWWD
jgi:hypothetical protein